MPGRQVLPRAQPAVHGASRPPRSCSAPVAGTRGPAPAEVGVLPRHGPFQANLGLKDEAILPDRHRLADDRGCRPSASRRRSRRGCRREARGVRDRSRSCATRSAAVQADVVKAAVQALPRLGAHGVPHRRWPCRGEGGSERRGKWRRRPGHVWHRQPPIGITDTSCTHRRTPMSWSARARAGRCALQRR
jgi:hypothetical protein